MLKVKANLLLLAFTSEIFLDMIENTIKYPVRDFNNAF